MDEVYLISFRPADNRRDEWTQSCVYRYEKDAEEWLKKAGYKYHTSEAKEFWGCWVQDNGKRVVLAIIESREVL